MSFGILMPVMQLHEEVDLWRKRLEGSHPGDIWSTFFVIKQFLEHQSIQSQFNIVNVGLCDLLYVQKQVTSLSQGAYIYVLPMTFMYLILTSFYG